MDAAGLAASHVLFVDDETDPGDVLTLVQTRLPHASRADDGSLRLSRHSTLLGPLDISAADADALGAGGIGTVFALRSPVERESAPPPAWMSSREGLENVFPAGLPVRDEGRYFELLVDVARRLGLTIRVADDAPGEKSPARPGSQAGTPGARPAWASSEARTLTPDPDDSVNLTVYSTFWLTPDTLLPVVRNTVPRAEMQMGFGEWDGPSQGVVDDPADQAARDELTVEERTQLHAAADQFDAAAMAEDPELEGYGITIFLPDHVDDADPANPPGGFIEILVRVEEQPVPALAGVDRGGMDLVAYEVRWLDSGERRYTGDRPAEFDAERRASRRYVDRLAVGVVEATSGVIVDEFGFLVDRYRL